jgi:signal transduction histidine kinase
MTGQSQPAVLPRHIAAAVTVAASARCAWAIGAAILVLAVPALVTSLAETGDLNMVGIPLAAVLVMLCAVAVMAWRPSTATLAGFIVVGAVCLWAYQFSLVSIDPQLQRDSVFVLNRPALALVLVGTASASPISAIGWGVAGYLAGQGAVILVAVQLDIAPATGAGPTIVLLNYIAVFLGVALVQRAQRGRVPDLRRLHEETLRSERQRDRDRAEAAMLHDTILSDLALIINAPAQVDGRVRARLLHDITTLANPDWVDVELRSRHPRDAEFRNALTSFASDFQWLGLRVDVSIDPAAVADLTPELADAALGAARACLENVLKHSGKDSAELILGVGTDASPGDASSDERDEDGERKLLTLMVVDAGVGFDPLTVPADRLGLRVSVMHRVESLGGTVRIWSAPGAGTSVLFSFPLPVRNETAEITV